tara:strand:+ start:969 stop:1433 length:465 start_codon:yes stop_codon:yes gene_type:complete
MEDVENRAISIGNYRVKVFTMKFLAFITLFIVIISLALLEREERAKVRKYKYLQLASTDGFIDLKNVKVVGQIDKVYKSGKIGFIIAVKTDTFDLQDKYVGLKSFDLDANGIFWYYIKNEVRYDLRPKEGLKIRKGFDQIFFERIPPPLVRVTK